MAIFNSHLYHFLSIGYLFLRGCLSAPTTSQNLTTNELTLVPFPLSLNSLPLLNLAPSFQDPGIKYPVPNTPLTMFFYLGFPIDELAMRDTIDAAKHYCELQIQRSGDVPLPQTEDPFHDDLGYGAAIHVVSVKPRHRITWVILKGIVQGLWDVLVEQGRYVEVEFHVLYADRGFVGRGTVTEAARAPTSR